MNQAKRYFYASTACVYNEDLQLDPSNPGLKEGDAWPAKPQVMHIQVCMIYCNWCVIIVSKSSVMCVFCTQCQIDWTSMIKKKRLFFCAAVYLLPSSRLFLLPRKSQHVCTCSHFFFRHGWLVGWLWWVVHACASRATCVPCYDIMQRVIFSAFMLPFLPPPQVFFLVSPLFVRVLYRFFLLFLCYDVVCKLSLTLSLFPFPHLACLSHFLSISLSVFPSLSQTQTQTHAIRTLTGLKSYTTRRCARPTPPTFRSRPGWHGTTTFMALEGLGRYSCFEQVSCVLGS